MGTTVTFWFTRHEESRTWRSVEPWCTLPCLEEGLELSLFPLCRKVNR